MRGCSLGLLLLGFGREYHDALVDTHLLADVYIELIGGKQTSLELSTKNKINYDNNLEGLINYSNKEQIIEKAKTKDFFDNPKSERTKKNLERI